MHLIEYDHGRYINAEKIEVLNISNARIFFFLEGSDIAYEVADSKKNYFMQKINSFDDNHVLRNSEHYPK